MKPLILFYDGPCVLCNYWIRKLCHWDKKDQLRFTSLDSEYANDFFKNHPTPLLEKDAILSWDSETVHTSFPVPELVPSLFFNGRLMDGAELIFNRVNGTAILFGVANPTEKYIQECTLKEDRFGCRDDFVVDDLSLACTVVEPKF